MTIIAAIRDPLSDTTWIGSDTRGCRGSIYSDVGFKWVRYGEWAVGNSGNLRAQNVMMAHAEELFVGLSGAYLFTTRARRLLKEDGFDRDKYSFSEDLNQSMILAHPKGLWSIGSDFSIVEVPAGVLWAEGSGREFALGAFHALQATRLGFDDMTQFMPESLRTEIGENLVRKSIEAAIAYDTGCGGRVIVEALIDGQG